MNWKQEAVEAKGSRVEAQGKDSGGDGAWLHPDKILRQSHQEWRWPTHGGLQGGSITRMSVGLLSGKQLILPEDLIASRDPCRCPAVQIRFCSGIKQRNKASSTSPCQDLAVGLPGCLDDLPMKTLPVQVCSSPQQDGHPGNELRDCH